VPGIKTKLEASGLIPMGLCGADFAAYLRQQHERVGRVVKAANIKAE
jgi:tripartite-type tricarboxylate transporter receptor subunit TctC